MEDQTTDYPRTCTVMRVPTRDVESPNLWPVGSELVVAYPDDVPAKLVSRVHRAAMEWCVHANIMFVRAPKRAPDAHVRVAFDPGGSWSYVGTDNLTVPYGRPTMNFGWLHQNSPEAELNAVVRHEFGHLIGRLHEHQHPTFLEDMDVDAVVRYFSGPPNHWDYATIESNVLRPDPAAVVSGEFDQESAMFYQWPKSLLSEAGRRKFSRVRLDDWNASLSKGDKAWAARAYPFTGVRRA